ncbi:MAG: nitroreductase family deazaflavin-dependent oxidoreductase [Thermoplasmata archaeon]
MGRRFGLPRRISRALNRRLLKYTAAQGLTALITLETQGRRTGRPHRVVLPVYPIGSHRFFVVSSYGRNSDWWRNVRAKPQVRFTRGNDTYDGFVRTVTFQAFRRRTGDPADGRSRASWLRRLVRLAFLFRARISGVVVEIERP